MFDGGLCHLRLYMKKSTLLYYIGDSPESSELEHDTISSLTSPPTIFCTFQCLPSIMLAYSDPQDYVLGH